MKKMFYVLLALLVSMVLVFGVSCDNSNKETEGPEFTIEERKAISESIMGLFISNLDKGVTVTKIDGYDMAVIVLAEDGVSADGFTMLKDLKAGINGFVGKEKDIINIAATTISDGTTYYVIWEAKTSST